MSSTCVDAVADRIGPDPVTFASLPLVLAQRIFLALLVDERARACCVSRAWRDALADPALWTRLDMSGVRPWRPLLPMLLGALDRARGELLALDLSQRYVAQDDLLPVLTANAGSLRELHLRFVRPPHDPDNVNDTPTVEAVVAAAPLLQVLTVEFIHCTGFQAPRTLRAQPPFAPLQMRRTLAVHFEDVRNKVEAMERFRPFADALADAALQPALQRLYIWNADTAIPELMGALADAVVARRLSELTLVDCMPPAAAPLARLLANGSLSIFNLHPGDPYTGKLTVPQFDAAGAALVADTLRVNTTLTALDIRRADLCLDVRVACALLGGLVGHRSLRELRLHGEETDEEDCGAFGAALAALIAADAPALHVLDCVNNALGDAGMAPIVEALPLNHHLRELDCRINGMSAAFARDQLMPVVQAHTSMRVLQ